MTSKEFTPKKTNIGPCFLNKGEVIDINQHFLKGRVNSTNKLSYEFGTNETNSVESKKNLSVVSEKSGGFIVSRAEDAQPGDYYITVTDNDMNGGNRVVVRIVVT